MTGFESFQSAGHEAFIDSTLQARGGPRVLLWEATESYGYDTSFYGPRPADGWHSDLRKELEGLGAEVLHVLSEADWTNSGRTLDEYTVIFFPFVANRPSIWDALYDHYLTGGPVGTWSGRAVIFTDYFGEDLPWGRSLSWIDSISPFTGVSIYGAIDDVRPGFEQYKFGTTMPLDITTNVDIVYHDATGYWIRLSSSSPFIQLYPHGTDVEDVAMCVELVDYANVPTRFPFVVRRKTWAHVGVYRNLVEWVVLGDSNVFYGGPGGGESSGLRSNSQFLSNLISYPVTRPGG